MLFAKLKPKNGSEIFMGWSTHAFKVGMSSSSNFKALALQNRAIWAHNQAFKTPSMTYGVGKAWFWALVCLEKLEFQAWTHL